MICFRIINLHQIFLLDYIIILSRVHSVIYRRAPPAPQGRGSMHAVPRRQASSPQLRQGASSCDEENYIQGVSGAIVGNPDTIHDEVTTQAFHGAIRGKCSLKFTGHYIIWLQQKMHLNYGIVQARVVNSSHDSIIILPVMRTTYKSFREI